MTGVSGSASGSGSASDAISSCLLSQKEKKCINSGFFIVANFKINMCLNPKNKALPWPKKTETERERERERSVKEKCQGDELMKRFMKRDWLGLHTCLMSTSLLLSPKALFWKKRAERTRSGADRVDDRVAFIQQHTLFFL